MGKILTTQIDRFNGGIVNDPRDRRENTCRIVSNFDIYTNPRKMTPYRNSEDGHSGASSAKPRNYLIAKRSGSGTGETYVLFTLSEITSFIHVQMKSLTTGGATDLGDNSWTTPSNNEGTTNVGTSDRDFNCFIWYRKTDRIYGGHGGTAIWSFDPTSSVAFNNAETAIIYSRMAQGLVHPKDDILYIPYDNFIATNNNGVWNNTALTLPNHYYITSICEMGNNIAVAISPTSGQQAGQSRVYIWDRNTSQTTLSETIPWEEGLLQVLEVVDGYLVGISISGTTTTRFRPRIMVRYLTGSEFLGFRAEQLLEIESTSTVANSITLPIAKQMKNGRLHFMMRVTIAGVRREGVWSIGKIGDQWSLDHERTPINDTAISTHVSLAPLYNFIYVGDYLFQTYSDSADAFAVSKTNDQASFTATSIYESEVFNAGDASVYKSLVEVTVTTEFLPSDGQIILLYQIDENIGTAFWGKIFTNTTDNSISRTGINIAETNDTITMSIASPAVVTLSNHDLTSGQAISFTTTGALPTGVTAGVTYFVISASLAAGTFQFSETRGGSAVNTSGTQSGTHTMSRTAPLPKQYKEIQLRIESTGNAEVTGLIFKEEVLARKYDTT